MTTRPGEEPIEEQIRDNLFAAIRTQNDNNICIDCEKKNPKWASIHLGIHLCLDCAGKHRQYGVIYSFIKSISLDVWNRKQLLFMEKGGNSRALEYFRKRGVITPTNRHIDYKSPIVQQYKAILSEEVELQLSGGVKPKPVEQKKRVQDVFSELEAKEQKKIQIPTAEVVEQAGDKPKKKKEKKKIGAKQIVIDDFENLAFDNGVSTEEKDKIVKEYEKKIDSEPLQPVQGAATEVATIKIQQPKELSAQQVKKKLEELKLQTNVKTISSDSFKDTSIDNVTLKQNLNKFSASSSISSSAFFNKEEETSKSAQVVENVKDFVSNAGEKLFTKISGLSSYWNK